MGDLSSLIAWHYLDPPDEFERRRNHTIYSQELNPQYYTNNRNAFVDHPEFVWSVYVDQENDSMLTIEGATIWDDSASVLDLQFDPVIVGAPWGNRRRHVNRRAEPGNARFSANSADLPKPHVKSSNLAQLCIQETTNARTGT